MSWDAVVSAQNASALIEGDTLRAVLESRTYGRLGYSSFHDFAVEAAELTYSTARRRVTLSRIATAFPQVRTALGDGVLSPCQALALRSVLNEETVDLWLSLARNRSVSEIEEIVSRVREATARAKDTGADPDAEPEPGRVVSFPAPMSARLAFEEGIERARQMLGYDAPHHACIAAMLAEASASGWTVPVQGAPSDGSVRCGNERLESGLESGLDSGSDSGPELASGSGSKPALESPLESAAAEVDGSASNPREERIRRLLREELHRPRSPRRNRSARRAQSSTQSSRSEEGPANVGLDGRAVPPLRSADGPANIGLDERADPSLRSAHGPANIGLDERAGPALRSTDGPANIGPRDTTGVHPDRTAEPEPDAFSASTRRAMARAESTVRSVEIEIEGFTQLLDESLTPADTAHPSTSVERFEEVRTVAAPMRVLALHVLRDLVDLDAWARLGYRSLAAFALDRLRVSERTMRQLLHESRQLDLRPDLERAMLAGHVGSSKFRLLETVDRHRLPRFLARARDITHRQLIREVRVHEKLRALRSALSIEESNRVCSISHDSGTRKVLRPDPMRTSATRSRPIFVLPDRMLDPLPQPGLERALRRVLLQHGWSNDVLDRELARLDPTRGKHRSSTGEGSAATAANNAQEPSARDPRTSITETNAEGVAEREIQRLLRTDPAANPMLMRRIELLLNLALLAVFPDSLHVHREVHETGRQTLSPEGPLTNIRFWAPASLLEDLDRFFQAVRERLGPLPDWAAFCLLLRDAIESWRQVDPESRPRHWRVLERDAYHCQAPGCTSRRGLEAHHVRFRSQQGSDDPDNIISICHSHHRHGIHERHLCAWGDASIGLHWVFAPNGESCHRRFISDRRIEPR